MDVHLSIEELRAYTDEERGKWDLWFRAQAPQVFAVGLQSNGSFATVWRLLDHIFVVERRHLQRLRSEYPLPETTGMAEGEWPAIWDYAARTRVELLNMIGSLSAADLETPRPLPIMGATRLITPRKLLFHVFIHEIRHWAQISLAVRNAGFEPPQDQDLIFSSALA
jgi:uncharacterized damage-inducible protein DinB